MSEHRGHWAELNRASCANIILASLPSSARQALLQNATLIRLDQGTVVYGQGDSNPDVLFPISGLLSGIDASANGAPLATAFRGREGAYGAMMAANGPRAVDAAHEVVCELPGEAIRIPQADIRAAYRTTPELAGVVLMYAALLLSLSEHHASCAHHHRLEARTAYWLLLLQAHARSNRIGITHEHMARVLGAHRPSISAILADLEGRGLVERSRGHVTIVDVAGLRRSACECRAQLARIEQLHAAGRFVVDL